MQNANNKNSKGIETEHMTWYITKEFGKMQWKVSFTTEETCHYQSSVV